MDIFEMIEETKKSEYGATWFSEKGPIYISKDGNLIPIKLTELPKYQPESSKREDLIKKPNPILDDPCQSWCAITENNGND